MLWDTLRPYKDVHIYVLLCSVFESTTEKEGDGPRCNTEKDCVRVNYRTAGTC